MPDTNFCNLLLDADITPQCLSPVVRGMEANGILINRSQTLLDETVFDCPNIISALPLADGARAYRIHVPTATPFNGTATTMDDSENRKTFTHNLNFILLDNGPDTGSIIDQLAGGEFIAIVENRYKAMQKTGNAAQKAAFQIMGFYQGLRAAELVSDKYASDTQGGWRVSLVETASPSAALYFFNTSYSATRAAVEAMCNQPQSAEE